MLTVLSPIIVLGIVVFVHELGHFLAAKSVRVYAPVFALGWGSRLVGFRRGETDYRIAWLPLGGYVQMASANDETMRLAGHDGGRMLTDAGIVDVSSAPDTDGPRKGINPVPWDPNAMHPFGPQPVPADRWMESKPLWARLWILSAGVLMNFVLAFAFLVLLYSVWGDERLLPVTGTIGAGTPAAQAGLLPGDRITAVNGARIDEWDQMTAIVRQSADKPVEFTVDRGGTTQRLTIQPRMADGQDPITGKRIRVGQVGITPSGAVERIDVPAGEVVPYAIARGREMFSNVFKVLGGLLTRDISVKQLGGPIAIARTSVAAARLGVESVVELIAFLSINIAVLNLLPIPVLDGGQMLYAIAERLRGRAFSERARERFFQVGTVMVLLLIVTVMWNDIVRWVTGGGQ